MSRVHIAILKRPYAQAILSGTKTLESRLTRNPGPPFGLVSPGEKLYLKVSAGPFVGRVTARAVHAFADLTPPQVQTLARRFEPGVVGGAAYWQLKRDCRYATFIELADVERIDIGPPYRVVHMRAWYALDAASDPVCDIPLTAGAIRNRYVALPAEAGTLGGAGVTLCLPDGHVVRTQAVDGRRLRWRGWGPYFARHLLREGDVVRLIALGGRRYRVEFRRS